MKKTKDSHNKIVFIALLIIVACIAFYFFITTPHFPDPKITIIPTTPVPIDSKELSGSSLNAQFLQCVKGDGVIDESYPRHCTAPDGKEYMETNIPSPSPEASAMYKCSVFGTINCLIDENPSIIPSKACRFGITTALGTQYILEGLERFSDNSQVSTPGSEVIVIGSCDTETGRDMKNHIVGTLGIDESIESAQNTPIINQISPSTVSFGEKITLHGSGFTMRNNDIAFTIPGEKGQSYINKVYSLDGKTLSFYLPHELGVCAYSRMKEGEACQAMAVFLPKGIVQVSVVNKNGKSNSIPLQIN